MKKLEIVKNRILTTAGQTSWRHLRREYRAWRTVVLSNTKKVEEGWLSRQRLHENGFEEDQQAAGLL